MRNEWSELGADIKAGAWSEKVKNEWSELGAPKGKMAGVLSANSGSLLILNSWQVFGSGNRNCTTVWDH